MSIQLACIQGRSMQRKLAPSRPSQQRVFCLDNDSKLSPEVRQMMERARSRKLDKNHEWRVPTSEHDLSPLAKAMMRTARNDAIIQREKDRLKAKRELFELKKLATRVLIPSKGQPVGAKTKEVWASTLAGVQSQSSHSTKALSSVVSISPSTLLSICAGTKKRAVLAVTRRSNKENSVLASLESCKPDTPVDFSGSALAVQELEEV